MHFAHKRCAILLIVFITLSANLRAQVGNLFRLERSEVTFVSDAPLEWIAASNNACSGLLDVDKRTFAVKIPISAFEGFNSPLQREHFNENYLESRKWPDASFAGRIVEEVNLYDAGKRRIRAKGSFVLHGVAVERVIPCTVVVGQDGVRINAAFDVRLADHDIHVPRIVQQKIAPVVKVEVHFLFRPESP